MKKLLIICSLIAALSLSACSAENNTTTAAAEEKEIQEKTEAADTETGSEQEEDSLETYKDESKEDTDESDQKADGSDQKDDGSSLKDDESNRVVVDLRKKLITEGNLKDDDIRSFRQEDFDDDGADEAFALVKNENAEEYDDEQIVEGDIWFVSQDDCRKLLSSEGMGFVETDRILVLGNRKYELFDDAYATGSLTYAWYVDEDEVKDAPFSRIGTVITDEDNNKDSFRILDSSYDAEYDPEIGGTLGHTWKQYYFFYDENNDRICEYGGTEVEQSKAEYLCGIDMVSEFLPAGDDMTSLFYRSNGLVVMNYEHEEDGYISYYHMIYDFINGKFIDDNGEETGTEPLAGVYAKALCSDMAVYPEDLNNSGIDFDNVLEDKTGELPSDVFSELKGRYEDGYGDIVELSHPDHMVRFVKGGKQDHIYDETICGYQVLDGAYLIKIEWDGEKYMYMYREEGDLKYLYLLSDDGWSPDLNTYNTKTLQTYIKDWGRG